MTRTEAQTRAELIDSRFAQSGLTATPTNIIDHNTFQLFHCEDGFPTFAPTFTITKRMTQAITHIERVSSVWNGFQLEHCVTWFAPFQTAEGAI